MQAAKLRSLIDAALSWPDEDQEELLQAAREIETRRRGVYVLSPEERAAVQEGLDQARRGEFASDSEMNALWKSMGA